MTINHHLDDATLMGYAAGALPNALAAVVAAHAAMCAGCRAEIARHERVGAALLEGVSGVALMRGPPVLDGEADGNATVKARDAGGVAVALPAEAAAIQAPGAAVTGGGLPPSLARLVGASLDDIRWRPLAIGVWHRRLPLTGASAGDLRLIKAGPGRGLPAHGHSGSELTLVLRGDYADEVGTFGTGDVADLDEDIAHHPVAGATGCICLMACEKPARFHGLLARLLAPWHGL
jgi:putative transcriptional regulator